MFEERMRWSGVALGVLAVLLLIILVSTLVPLWASGSRLGVAIGLAAITVLCGVLSVFLTVRTRIDESGLTVGFGPFQKRVSLDEIAICRPTTYDWKRWGGFGIRGGRGVRVYNVPGDGGSAVELTMRDGQRLLVSSRSPETVCGELQRRRNSSAGPKQGAG